MGPLFGKICHHGSRCRALLAMPSRGLRSRRSRVGQRARPKRPALRQLRFRRGGRSPRPVPRSSFSGFHRSVTHSIGAIILVTIIAMAVTGWVTGRIEWSVSLVCGAAYGSHLLLDWLARDPNPPAAFKPFGPFSSQWFISGWNLFPPTERQDLLSARAILINLRAAIQGSQSWDRWLLLSTRIRVRTRGRTFAQDGRRPPSA